MTKKVVFFDIETHSAAKMWDMPPQEFVRLCQYAAGDGEVQLTTNLEELVEVLESADLVIGHNIVNFDLTAIYGKDSIRPLEMAMEGRVLDTMVLANLVFPSRYLFKMRPDENGKQRTVVDGLKPEKAKMWLSLDNLTFQLGLPGKIGDLKEMAHAAGKAAGFTGTKSEVTAQGFGEIPVDDETFLEYARQDIIAVRHLAYALRGLVRRSGVTWDYIWREMKIVSIDAQNTRNGVRIDVQEAQHRVEELTQQRDEIMNYLVQEFDFPTAGKSPWASAAGKEAILKILAHYGITEESHPDWKRTAAGALSLGGEVIKELTTGTEAEPIGEALAALKGQRSLAQLTLDSTRSDGRVHPDITRFQRSGRTSISAPAVTVWTARGPGAVEKRYFLADPGEKFVAMDLSNADQRIVAAYSGDIKYAKRFEPGADGHEINARIAVGDEVYDSDPKYYRNLFKACSHGWAYGGRAKTLAAQTGIDLEITTRFGEKMDAAFPELLAWKEDVIEEGRQGSVRNDWGRVMVVDKDRAYTQSPALYGQSGTRELVCDALIRVAEYDLEMIRWLRFQIHDELIWSIPENELWWAADVIQELTETTFKPREGGQAIHFPVGKSEPSDNWFQATH